MKVTLARVQRSYAAIRVLMENKDFSARLAFKLGKLGRQILDNYEALMKQFKVLNDKHSKKDEKGNPLPISKEAQQEVDDLLETEVEIDGAFPIELPEDAKVAPGVFCDLGDFVTTKG